LDCGLFEISGRYEVMQSSHASRSFSEKIYFHKIFSLCLDENSTETIMLGEFAGKS